MKRLEDALREALRREDPPAGFADRVMARVNSAPSHVEEVGSTWGGLWAAFRGPMPRLAAACAAIVLVVGGLEYRSQRVERSEGERAKDQVMLALRITGSKLRVAQDKVHEAVYVLSE